jgi:hypothetical protein
MAEKRSQFTREFKLETVRRFGSGNADATKREV